MREGRRDDLPENIQAITGGAGFVALRIGRFEATWLHLIRKTVPEQRRALGCYSAMREKLTNTGRGVQDAEMRAGARREMSVAKGAVPVWIMPLNEVADNFDPRHTRFDVVIIDEASQCDPTSMFALYLGDQASL
jgi:hypothetical protein